MKERQTGRGRLIETARERDRQKQGEEEKRCCERERRKVKGDEVSVREIWGAQRRKKIDCGKVRQKDRKKRTFKHSRKTEQKKQRIDKLPCLHTHVHTNTHTDGRIKDLCV